MKVLSSALLVAAKEFRDCRRNLWLITGTLLFALLSLGIVFGTAAIGGVFSFRPMTAVLNSLVSLSVFLIPLIAILISYDAFVGEAEQGTLPLPLTYPISRTSILLGKLIGHSAALFLCIFLGFSVLLILTAAGVLPYDFSALLRHLVLLALSGWMLGVISILLSYLISILSPFKAFALGILLVIWLALVIFYDLALLILAIADDSLTQGALNFFMVLNPASAFRLLNQESLGIVTTYIAPAYLGLYLLLCAVALFLADRISFGRRSL